jgi:hypothetical protein
MTNLTDRQCAKIRKNGKKSIRKQKICESLSFPSVKVEYYHIKNTVIPIFIVGIHKLWNDNMRIWMLN